MNELILEKLAEIKDLALLGAKDVLNMDEAKLYTQMSKSTLYKLCCEHKIPHYKNENGKLTYFKKSELADWLCANRVPTMAEIEQKALKHCITTKM